MAHLSLNRLKEYVKDFTAPTIEQLVKINKFIDSMINKNKPVLVHCLAAGRSGTIIVSHLIYHGWSFKDSLQYVRKEIFGAVEKDTGQEEILKKFENYCKNNRKMIRERKDYFGDTWYLQAEKIDDMYGKAVKRIEKEIIIQRNWLQKIFLGGRVSLGEIYKFIGLV